MIIIFFLALVMEKFFSDVNKLTKNDFKTLEHNLDTENIIFRDIIVNNKNIYISANEKRMMIVLYCKFIKPK